MWTLDILHYTHAQTRNVQRYQACAQTLNMCTDTKHAQILNMCTDTEHVHRHNVCKDTKHANLHDLVIKCDLIFIRVTTNSLLQQKKWCFHVFYWTFTVQDGHSMWTPWLMNSSRANWSQVSANLESNLGVLKWPRPLQNTHQFWVCYIAWCEAWLKQKSSQKTYDED